MMRKKLKICKNGLPNNTPSKIKLPPDISICNECLEELFSPHNRRYLYPFINCSNCGPKFSIVKDISYNRDKTSMYKFSMCPDCYNEYTNPSDRRFHTQSVCCPVCGPKYLLFDKKGTQVGTSLDAIKKAVSFVEEGHIVAMKGIGGYHLVCDATKVETVKTLRVRKKRGDKPFALMSKDINTIKQYCIVNKEEKETLLSKRAPVVILRRKKNCCLPSDIAPNNKYLGFFLPYTPAHYILFYFGRFDTIIATSANISDEPTFYQDADVCDNLSVVADYILTNNRKIEIGCDDSVVKIEKFNKKTHILRRSRGFVPEPIRTPFSVSQPVFATGADMKNTFSFGVGNNIFTSQHIGNLENLKSFLFYKNSYQHWKKITGFTPKLVACDLHPDYMSSSFAKEVAQKEGVPYVGVQHHHSHIAACMLENMLPNKDVIGIALDGTGFGEAEDIRGCEVMIASYSGYKRYAWLDYIGLPGGDISVKEVWRTGLSYLYNSFGKDVSGMNISLFKDVPFKKMYGVYEMLKKDINCTLASSMGRLFDGVASIIGLQNEVSFDAQAAIALEMVANKSSSTFYSFDIKQAKDKGSFVIDYTPVIRDIVKDILKNKDVGLISCKFHKGVVEIITEICKAIKQEKNISATVLTGGVFQNSFLMKMMSEKLTNEGFQVYTHSLLPSNDGGISAGQVAVASFSQLAEF
ncbi:carbamoyltransferase HypF [bacterium]|nr:carbamoyltransferase HypF [bacterium]